MLGGHLFTRDWLLEGVKRSEQWRALSDDEMVRFEARLSGIANAFVRRERPNEAQTEKDFIYPVLEALGWTDVQVQQILSPTGRKQVPDAILFAGPAEKARAAAEKDPHKAYAHGLAIVEAKRWDRALDRIAADKREAGDRSVPSTQMLQYLSRVDVQTSGKVRLGILTNGAAWRLYFQGALSVSEEHLEIDLAKALGLEGHELDLVDRADPRLTTEHVLRLFYLLFGKAAFLPGDDRRTFHEIARDAGKVWEEQVTTDLSKLVFDDLFPKLVGAIARHDAERPSPIDQAYLDAVHQSALVLLYRLLFVVYAEDRDLLPDATEPYKSYSLTAMRLEIAEQKARGRVFSGSVATYWPKLFAVFKVIAKGDDALGVPPYNGGLFSEESAPILDRIALPDDLIADVIYGLSHRIEDGAPRYINYRDLSVQQLGTVYEKTLEYVLREENGAVVVDPDATARHASGSYYTPDSLVMLIIEKTIGPLVEEALAAFKARAEELAKDPRREGMRTALLRVADPAAAILKIKVCDPAMGSGHFLVSLVDWLADRALAAIQYADELVDWGDYESPVIHDIRTARHEIQVQAEERGWRYEIDHLDDRHLVRRIILKRCIYGVDMNPMAVELAKVALWLHSFTVGAPLSFLDHHLRCGNSLMGAWVRPAMDKLAEWGGALLIHEAASEALGAATSMQAIEKLADVDIAEVTESRNLFVSVSSLTSRLRGLMDVVHAADLVASRTRDDRAALDPILRGGYGDPAALAQGRKMPPKPKKDGENGENGNGGLESPLENGKRALDERARAHIAAMREHVRSMRPFHWQVAFPGMWRDWEEEGLHGGFDAVIGNPPYVRQELIRDLKPALQKLFPATWAGTADLYVYFYEQGLRLVRPGGRMAYTVTNKWLRAGYAESLREHFATKGWLEFVADFGHAKHFFPDADVFPSVVVVRKPDDGPAPEAADVCVIPRDDVPEKGLGEAVAAATYKLPLAHFTKESWVLEPPDVVALLDKIRRNGVPLAEYAGVKPYRGVLTGFNEAFLVDTPTRDRLVRDDPKCAEIIKPHMRGQDVDRWQAPPNGIWLIFARRGIDIDGYPSVRRHLERFRAQLEPRPNGWKPAKRGETWPGRKEGSYAWYELQDATDYWPELQKPKIIYQEIQYHPCFALDLSKGFVNNKVFLLPTDDKALLSVLNSPAAWWFDWRYLPHMKDEALTPAAFKFESMPVAPLKENVDAEVDAIISGLSVIRGGSTALHDWLRHEFGLEKPGAALAAPHTLSADDFVAAVRAAFPKSRKWRAAEIARLEAEHAETLAPAREAAAQILTLERKLSDLVNAAYGLTKEEVALMWRTAPPRMPLDPQEELRRLGV